MRLLVALLFLLTFCGAVYAQPSPPYGPGPPPPSTLAFVGDASGATDVTAALNTFIANAIAAGRKTVTLSPGGVYAISTRGVQGADGNTYYNLLINNATAGFTLDCKGATLLNTGGQTSPDFSVTIMVQNSSHVTLKDCIYDDRYLQFAQGVLTNVGSTYADFTIDPDYAFSWTTIDGVEQRIAAPGTSTLPAGYPVSLNLFAPNDRAVTNLGSNVYRVDYSADLSALAALSMSSSYLLMHNKVTRSAIMGYKVTDFVLDGGRIYAAAGHGISTLLGTDIRTLNGFGTYIKPGTTRWMSTNADDHIRFQSGTADFSEFHAEGNGDDGLNIFGDYSPVTVATDATHITILLPVPGYSFNVGDTLQAINSSGVLQGTATVQSSTCTTSCSIVLSGAGFVGIATTWAVTDQTQSPTLTVRNGTFSRIRGHGVVYNALVATFQNNSFSYITQGAIFCPAPAYTYQASFLQGPYCDVTHLSGNVANFVNFENYLSSWRGLGGDPAVYEIYVQNLAGDTFASATQLSVIDSKNNFCSSTNNYCYYYAGSSAIASLNDYSRSFALNFQTANFGTLAAEYIGVTAFAEVCPRVANAVKQSVLYGVGYTGEHVSICQPTGTYTITATNAGSVTIANDASNVLIKGAVASYTVTLPAAPTDKQLVSLIFQGGITTLTVNANSGQTKSGSVSTAAANVAVRYIYDSSSAVWTMTN
jgi:archaellum component FlaF (FlaF/FlaG flagellin family)